MNRTIALFLMGSLVTGCATTKDQVMLEGCGTGALVGTAGGAAAGAAIGAAAGDKNKHKQGAATGAAIGAGVGLIAGLFAGCTYADSLNKRYDQLRGKESDLNAQIQFAQGVNKDSIEYNNKLRAQVNANEENVAELAAKKTRNEATQSELEKERTTLTKTIQQAEQTSTNLQGAIAELKQFRSQRPAGSTANLDGEIAGLESQLAQLRGATQSLAAQRQRIE